jgi:hypothetical protein
MNPCSGARFTCILFREISIRPTDFEVGLLICISTSIKTTLDKHLMYLVAPWHWRIRYFLKGAGFKRFSAPEKGDHSSKIEQKIQQGIWDLKCWVLLKLGDKFWTKTGGGGQGRSHAPSKSATVAYLFWPKKAVDIWGGGWILKLLWARNLWREINAMWLSFIYLFSFFFLHVIISLWKNPVRIRVRIDPPHPPRVS